MFFFQFIFVFPARYVRMRNFSGKSKQAEAVYMMATCALNELKHYQNEELRKRICHSLVSLQHIFRVQPVTYLNISNSKLA